MITTLIHTYAHTNKLVEVQLELEKGMDVNVRDKDDGETPLHLAAAAGHIEMVHFLLEKGADIYIQETIRGYTSLHEAVVGLTLKPDKKENYYQVFELLLRHDTKLHQEFPEKYPNLKNIKDRFNGTALEYLAKRNLQASKILLAIIEQVNKEVNASKQVASVEIKLERALSHRFNPSGLKQRKKTSDAINHAKEDVKTITDKSHQNKNNDIIFILSKFFSPLTALLNAEQQQQERRPLLPRQDQPNLKSS